MMPSNAGSGTFQPTELSMVELARSLASAFLSGHISHETAVSVQRLFPGAQLLSLSLLAGGRLLITEQNLIQQGYVKVHFQQLEQTVAGQAIVLNSNFFTTVAQDRHQTFTDLWEAQQQGCHCMTSAPISQRQRRASIDACPCLDSATSSARNRRNSTSSDGLSNPAKATMTHLRRATRGPPLGSLTLGLPGTQTLSSMHLKNLTDLAETLSPLLERYCRDVMDSLFSQPDFTEAGEQVDSCEGELAWRSSASLEEYVDNLVCRQLSEGACCDSLTMLGNSDVSRAQPQHLVQAETSQLATKSC